MPNRYQLDGFAEASDEIERLSLQVQELLGKELRLYSSLVDAPIRGSGLDVGCGPGFAAAGFMKHWPDLQLTGVDQDKRAVREARKRIEAIVGSAERLPFDDNSKDFACARYLLRHVSEPVRVVSEMSRVVRPGGWVLITDADDGTMVLDGLSQPGHLLLQERRRLIERAGANPNMGRSLRRTLLDAGLRNVRGATVVLDSESVGPRVFREIAIRPRETAEGFDNIEPSVLTAGSAAFDEWQRDDASFATINISLFVAQV